MMTFINHVTFPSSKSFVHANLSTTTFTCASTHRRRRCIPASPILHTPSVLPLTPRGPTSCTPTPPVESPIEKSSVSTTIAAVSTLQTPEQQPTPPPGIANSSPPLSPPVLFAEFISTFLLVLFSLLLSVKSLPLTPDGFLIAALAASFIPASGAHFNPAVTIALLCTHRVSLKRAIAFIPLQLLASLFASMLASSSVFNIPLNPPIVSITSGIATALFREFLPMFFVVCVVFMTAVANKKEGGVGVNIAPLYIGMAVVVCAAAVPGSVFNPARAFGPALLSGVLANHWVLWVGPIFGAITASLMCEHLFLSKAGKRQPTSWLQWMITKTVGLADRVKTLGFAGIVSYGIMNTLYYSCSFTVMMIQVGWNSGAAGVAQAWLVTWTFSQVTKPLRLMISVFMAPFVDRWMTSFKRNTRKKT